MAGDRESNPRKYLNISMKYYNRSVTPVYATSTSSSTTTTATTNASDYNPAMCFDSFCAQCLYSTFPKD